MPDSAVSSDSKITIATLVGSLRQGSYHAAIARALPALAPSDVRIAPLGSIGDFPLYNGDIEAKGIPAPVEAMGKAIRQADALLIVTPEYNYSVPGPLKNALDWLSRLPSAPFTDKALALLSGSPGTIAGARAQYHLRQALVFFDVHILSKPEVMIGQVHTKVDVAASAITDDQTREIIGAQLQALAKLARRCRA